MNFKIPHKNYSSNPPQIIIMNHLRDHGECTYDALYGVLLKQHKSGNPSSALQGLMRKGIVIRVRKGVYALAGLPAGTQNGKIPDMPNRGGVNGNSYPENGELG